MSDRNRSKYVILGAGITGLSLAYFLSQRFPKAEICVLEAKDRVGGWVETKMADSFLFEKGPHSLRLSPPYQEVCEKLFDDLNLSTQILPVSSLAKKKYLAYNQKLHPLSFFSFNNLCKISYPLIRGCFKSCSLDPDESIFSFSKKHFGTYMTKKWIDPLVMGIYGGDLKKLSALSCFPILKEAACSSSPLLFSLLKKMRNTPSKMISFKKGLSSLTQALKENTKAQFILNGPARAIQFTPKPVVHLFDQKIDCDHLFSTLPPYILSQLLPSDLSQELSYLKEVPYVSYKMVHIGYHQKCFVPPGFGFLSPSWDTGQISGAIFDSEIFPSQSQNINQTRLSVMIHENKPLFYQTPEEIKKGVLEEIRSLLRINVQPDFFKIYSLDRAIPQYCVGHQLKIDRVKKILLEKSLAFSFLGNGFYGVSLPSCIFNAEKLASTLFKQKNFVNT